MSLEGAPLGLVSLTTTQRDALASPVAPAVIWNSTVKAVQYYTGAQWVTLAPLSRKAVADAAHTAGTTDATIYGTYAYTSITANRIFTLCAANAVPAGWRLRVEDASGSVKSPAVTGTGIEIQVKPAGSDTVEGVAAATNFEVIRDARGSIELESDGSSNWSIVAVVPSARYERFTCQTTGTTSTYTAGYRKPLTAKQVRVIAIGGGGGGSAGSRQAASTVTGGGGGGSGGGLSDITLAAADMSATETVVAGAGGASVAGRSATAGNGTAGNAGTASSMTVAGTVSVFADGGHAGGTTGSNGGTGGTQPSAATTSISSAFAGASIGAYGADGGGNIVAGTPGSGVLGGPGGGGGGGGTTTGALVSASDGAAGSVGTGPAGAGAAGGPRGTPPTAGTAISAVLGANAVSGGGGGGGGAAGRSAAGQDGAIGGTFGGGGGGGGGSSTAGAVLASGAGGAGGDGAVLVVTYR